MFLPVHYTSRTVSPAVIGGGGGGGGGVFILLPWQNRNDTLFITITAMRSDCYHHHTGHCHLPHELNSHSKKKNNKQTSQHLEHFKALESCILSKSFVLSIIVSLLLEYCWHSNQALTSLCTCYLYAQT